MRLTQWTDYALRVLMYCASHQQREHAPTIAEIAEVHGISRSHLMKIVMELSAKGWLSTTRGRGGGLRLVQDPSQIVVGEVVRQMEEDFTLVECFSTEGSSFDTVLGVYTGGNVAGLFTVAQNDDADADHRTKLVFITKDLDESFVSRLWEAFLDRPGIDTPDRSAMLENPLSLRRG